ncbi:MAG: lytic transglycosylase F [Spirochaetaceae bacterium]|nr:MAG: lytic transglycosylase F [Spirochaetaceae bacterium]
MSVERLDAHCSIEYILQNKIVVWKENTVFMKLLTLLMVSVLALSACSGAPETSHSDLEQIIERGHLNVITMAGPVSYFVYRGQPMGYEYELINRFADSIALPVQLVLADSIDEMFELLEAGEGDLIAYRLAVTAERRERVAFTDPLHYSRQVLVQRRPADATRLTRHEIEERMIRNPVHLSGQTVHVRGGAHYAERLHHLSAEIGGEIAVVEADPSLSTADLIAMVAAGTVDLTVAEQDIALLFAAAVPGLDATTPVSLEQQISWALRPETPDLMATINHWLERERQHADFFVIHRKYFVDALSFRNRINSPFLAYEPVTADRATRGAPAISQWDDLLQEEAERIGWDWRQLAALVHTESRFNPRARSWMGAMGLMQLMPATARYFGALNPFDPSQNVRAGVSFLEWLQHYWGERIEDPEQRLRFIIASYNVGQGHVEDARRLASIHQANPDVWHAGVSDFLLAKADPRYYTHEVVQFGFARGSEPVQFVERILSLTEHYRRFFD